MHSSSDRLVRRLSRRRVMALKVLVTVPPELRTRAPCPDGLEQSGGAAAPRVRPGLRSLRSPAPAGVTNGPCATSPCTVGRPARGGSRVAAPARHDRVAQGPAAPPL